MFLAFQYPVELPGVNNANFLRTALNALRRARGETELDAVQFLKLARAETKRLAMPDDMLKRNVNVGFSGGEKKRNEVLQMAMLRPRLAILDETDSGLDIDALKIVADGVNALRGPEFSALVITHYQRLLDHIVPDRVHVLAARPHRALAAGPNWRKELEASGYAGMVAEAAMNAPPALRRRVPAQRYRRRLRGAGLPGRMPRCGAAARGRRSAAPACPAQPRPPRRGMEIHQPAPARRGGISMSR